MGKHSTSRTRAARRDFWNSKPLVATGRFLDRLRGTQRRIAGVALVVLFVLLGSVTDFQSPLDPCPTEDSTWCYWDGDSRGNKSGKSFIAFTEQFVIHF